MHSRRLGIVLGLIALTTFPGCKLGFLGLGSAGKNGGVISSGANAPLPPSYLAMFGPSSVVSGVCSDVMTVMGMDSNGSPAAPFPQGTMVSLNGTEAGTIFLDSACTLPAAVGNIIPVLPNTNRAEFFVKAMTSGSRSMSGSIPGMPDASGSMMVMAGPAAKLQINFPNTINSNTCVLGSLALLDENNNPTTATFDITSKFNFNVNNGTAIYSDGTCDTVATNGMIESGLSSKNIWVFTPAATAFTVNMNPISNITIIPKSMMVNAANMPKLVIQAPANMTAGVCTLFTVQTMYANNTAYKVRVPTSIQMFNILTSAKYFSNSDCSSSVGNGVFSIPAFGSSVNVWMTATQATQTLNLSADSTGYTSAAPSSTLINANVPTSIGISGVPTEIPANRCSSALQVELHDAYGNVAKAVAQLTLTPEFTNDQLTFFTAGDCGGNGTNALTINNNESSTTFYFKARNPGDSAIRVKSGALTPALSQSILIKNALDIPNNIKLSAVAPNLSITAGECVPVKISSFDANNFPLDVFPNDITFNLNSNSSVTGIFYSNPGCTTAATSVKIPAQANFNTFYIKNTKVDPNQPKLITAQSTTPALMATLPFTTVAAEPEQLFVVGNLTSVPAATCNGLSIVSKDRYDNLSVPASEMNVDLEGGQHVTFYTDAMCTLSTRSIKIVGQDSAPFWFKVGSLGNAAAADPVTLVAIGPTGVAAGSKLVAVAPPTPIHVMFVPPQTLKVGVCMEFQAVALDNNNQPLVREPIRVPLNLQGGSANPLFTDPGCGTAMVGNEVTISQSNNPAKFYLFTRTSGDISISTDTGGSGSTSISFTVAPGAGSQVVFVDNMGPSTVDTETCTGPFKIELRDEFGNLTPATTSLPVTASFVPSGNLFENSNCSTPVGPIAAGSSSKEFYLKIGGNGGGSVAVSAGGFSDSRTFTVLPPATIVFSVNGQAATAFDFGTVNLGAASSSLVVTATNNSNTKSISVQSIAIPSPFRRQSGTCASGTFLLAPGASCDLSVDFAPSAQGGATGAINFGYMVSNVAASNQFLLSGTGAKPTTGALVFVPDSLNAGTIVSGDMKRFPVVLKNVGGGPATGITFNSTGDLGWENHSSCGVLAENEECNLFVQVSPRASGPFSGKSVVDYFNGTANKKVELFVSADVSLPATLVLNVNPLEFEGVGLGQDKTLNATVENRGSLTAVNIQYSIFSVTGDFTLNTGTCPATLPAGGSCTLSVKFAPTARANFTGVVNMIYETQGYPQLGAAMGLFLSGSGYSMGQLTFTPAALQFPNTLVGASRTLPISVKNTGDRPVSNLSVSLTANNPAFTVDKDTGCSQTIAAGQTCVVYISYAPTAVGSESIKFKLGFNNSVAPVFSSEYEASGTAVTKASLAIAPSPLDLGTVPVGGESSTQDFTVTNVGADNATSIAFLAPPQGSPFKVVSQGCPASLAPQAKCTVSVKFKPTAADPQPLIQSFGFNYRSAAADSSLPLNTVSVNATAVATTPGSLSLAANTVDFGVPLANSGTATKKLRFTNSGNFNIPRVTLGSATAPFAIRGGSCGSLPFALAAGASCEVEFDLGTANTGTFNQSIGIVYNNGAADVSGGILQLKGTVGVAGDLVFPVSPVNLGQVVATARKTVNVTVSNTGDFAVTPGTLLAAAPFSATLGTCSPTIPAKSTCTLAVSFEPNAAGSFAGSLSLAFVDATNQRNGQATVSLQGTSINAGALSLSQGSYDFGSVYAGSSVTLPIVLTNQGQSGVSRITASLTPAVNEITILSNDCASVTTLDAGRSCTIQVKFSPTAGVDGLKTTKLYVSFENELGSKTLAPATISGTGVSGAFLTASISPLDFGTIAVNGSKSLAFTITNTGHDMATKVMMNVFQANAAFTVATTCPVTTTGFSLAQNGSCTYTVTYRPTAVGNHSQSFQFSYRSSLAPATTPNLVMNVPISGKAVPAGSLELNVSTIDFGIPKVGTVVYRRIILSNPGGVAATAINMSGLAAPFTLNSNSCGAFPITIPPQGQCEIELKMNAATAGSYQSSITFTYNNGAGSNSFGPIVVKGIAGVPANLASTPTSAAFGRVTVGKTTSVNLVLRNTGNYPAEITSTAGISAPFALDLSGCSPTIAPLSSCSVRAIYTPTAVGAIAQAVSLKYRDTVNLGLGDLVVPFSAEAVAATVLTPSVTTLDLGTQVIGGPGRNVALFFTNSGPATIRSIGVSLTTTDNNLFINANLCSTINALPSGARCEVDIAFLARTVGNKTGTLNVSYVNEVGTMYIEPIAIKGVSISPALINTPAGSADFGTVVIGKDSSPVNLTLQNTGQDAARVTFTAPNQAFIVTSPSCATSGTLTIAGGASCAYVIVFRPTAVGAVSSFFKYSYTSSLGGTSIPVVNASIPLSGTGALAGRVVTSGTNINLGKPLQGTNPVALRFTVTNTGGYAATGIRVNGLSAPFTVAAGSCGAIPFNLTPNTSCELLFNVSTATPGTFATSYYLSYNDGVKLVSLPAYNISALVGVRSTLVVNPASFSFVSTPVGGVSTKTFTVTNTGDYDLTSVLMTGFPAGMTGSLDCVDVVRAKTAYNLTVTYRPTVPNQNIQPQTVTLSYRDVANAISSTSTFSLSGHSYNPGNLVPNPLTVSFPARVIGTAETTQPIIFINQGSSVVQNIRFSLPVNDIGMVLKGTDGQSNYCSASTTLLAGSSCFVNIGFSPKKLGTQSVKLSTTFTNELGAAAPVMVTLQGTAVSEATLVTSPATMDFGTAARPVLLNTTLSQNITVINNGGYKASGIVWSSTIPQVRISGGSCVGKSELAPQESCTVTLSFSAATRGNYVYTFNAAYNTGLKANNAKTLGVGYAAPASMWVQTYGGVCPAVCALLGRVNIPDAAGNYCTSGELVPVSAAPTIKYTTVKQCWPGSYNLGNQYCSPHGHPNGRSVGGSCYGYTVNSDGSINYQKIDGDLTDITMGCHCS